MMVILLLPFPNVIYLCEFFCVNLLLFQWLTSILVALPGCFHVWLASPEAEFLKGRFVWVNWDVDELKAHAKEIEESMLLKVVLNGVAM